MGAADQRRNHLSPPGLRRLASLMLCVVTAVLAVAQEGSATTGQGAVPSHRQADNVAIITIDEDITKVTAFSFLRRLEIAEQAGADAVVIELNTNGGELGAVLEITDAIRSSSITNSVAWIHSKAYSGGAIIALACKEIVSSASGRMGDALVIAIGPTGLMNLGEAERLKLTAPVVAEVVSSARLRGWDEYVVQAFAALGVELWWVRDTVTGEEFAINEDEYRLLFDDAPPRTRPMIAGPPTILTPEEPAEEEATPPVDAAPGPADGSDGYRPAAPALRELEIEPEAIGRQSTRRTISEADRGRYELVGYLFDGESPLIVSADEMAMLGLAANVGPTGALQPIQNDQDLADFFGAQNVRRLQASWSEHMVRILTGNIARGVLIVVFLLALFLELSHPGVGLPGAVAAVALVALLAPPAVIGMANWWEIGAILVGILLVGLELFVIPGFGIAGVAGLLLLFGGLLGTFVGDTPGGLFPDSRAGQSRLWYGLVTIFLSTATAGLLMYFAAKHFGSIPLIGSLVLKDVSGEVAADADLLAGIPVRDTRLPKVGATGRTITPLRPSGRAEIGDRVLDVVTDIGYIDSGRPVRVVSADTFRIVVEEAPEPGSAPA